MFFKKLCEVEKHIEKERCNGEKPLIFSERLPLIDCVLQWLSI